MHPFLLLIKKLVALLPPVLLILFSHLIKGDKGKAERTETQKKWNEHFGNKYGSGLGKWITWIAILIFVLVGLYYFSDRFKDEFLYVLGGRQESTVSPRNDGSRSAHSFTVDSAKQIEARFKDVIGLESAKKSAGDFILAIKHPENFEMLGAKAPKAVIFHGPPGNGKTLLARALAGEAQVNIVATTGSNFVQKWVGLGAARVRELFAIARRNKPCIIFIDEFEVLAPNRERLENEGGNSEYHGTVNQLLSELDGFDEKKNRGVYLVAATNYLGNVDKAVIRSGRFDRKIYIGLPTVSDREKILKLHLKRVTTSPSIDIPSISKQLDSFSGADIAAIVNEAALVALRNKEPQVGNKHLREAIKEFKKDRLRK